MLISKPQNLSVPGCPSHLLQPGIAPAVRVGAVEQVDEVLEEMVDDEEVEEDVVIVERVDEEVLETDEELLALELEIVLRGD